MECEDASSSSSSDSEAATTSGMPWFQPGDSTHANPQEYGSGLDKCRASEMSGVAARNDNSDGGEDREDSRNQICYLRWINPTSASNGSCAKLATSPRASGMSTCGVAWSFLNFAADAWLILPLPTSCHQCRDDWMQSFMEFRCTMGQSCNGIRLWKHSDARRGTLQRIQIQLHGSDEWSTRLYGSWMILADGSIQLDYGMDARTPPTTPRHIYRRLHGVTTEYPMIFCREDLGGTIIRVDGSLGWRADVLEMLRAAGLEVESLPPILDRFLHTPSVYTVCTSTAT